MKGYKILLFYISLFYLLGCTTNTSENLSLNINNQQNNDYLYGLNEIKEIQDMKSKLPTDHNLIFLKKSDTIDNGKRYLWIQVGYDNGYRIEILENYYINTKDTSIYRLETITDSLIKVN